MIYYAYGSLLDRDRLRELCPTAKPLSAAKIPHHSICFTGHSESWGGGTATITPATARDLWGGLYEIDEAGRAAVEGSGALDGYVWCFTAVESRDGGRLRAGLLVKVRDLEPSQPSQRYLKTLERGWKEWDLDEPEILADCEPVV